MCAMDEECPSDAPACLDPAVPLLWRDTTTLQVGLDPAQHVVLAGASQRTVDTVREMRASDDLRAPWREPDGDRRLRLHRRLTEAGLLSCGGPWRAARRTWVQVVGSGVVASAVVSALAHLDLERCDSAPTPSSMAPDLVVVAPDHGRGDQVAEHLMSRGTTHLWAHLRDGRAVVGPLVEPGLTACLRCHDLSLAGEDEAWPDLLVQWQQSAPRSLSPSVTLLAGLVVRQVHQWLVGREHACRGATVHETALGTVEWRQWPIHPACGCVWAPAGGAASTGFVTR
jgi:hypothetical protein